jgi:transposase
LAQESFACEADARKAIQKFEQTCHYCGLSQVSVVQQVHHGKRGRPKQGSQPQSLSYHLQATLIPNSETIEEHQRIAGRFILATNELECESLNPLEPESLNAVEVLAEYKKQQSSERGFRFLKDPLFFTDSVFLKSRQRIMALAMVMALCLLVYLNFPRMLVL